VAILKKKSPLLRKLAKVLVRRFPPPATVRLEVIDGIIGIVVSDEFEPMDSIDRQALMSQILKSELSDDERQQVHIIVCVTPMEETGYLAGADFDSSAK
jgi:hypothetical protein